MEELTCRQCMALGIKSLQKECLNSAEMYFFKALKDPECFSETLHGDHLMGIRMRAQGEIDNALAIYQKPP